MSSCVLVSYVFTCVYLMMMKINCNFYTWQILPLALLAVKEQVFQCYSPPHIRVTHCPVMLGAQQRHLDQWNRLSMSSLDMCRCYQQGQKDSLCFFVKNFIQGLLRKHVIYRKNIKYCVNSSPCHLFCYSWMSGAILLYHCVNWHYKVIS